MKAYNNWLEETLGVDLEVRELRLGNFGKQGEYLRRVREGNANGKDKFSVGQDLNSVARDETKRRKSHV